MSKTLSAGTSLSRRTLLKAGGALALGSTFPMPAIAATQKLKIGYITGATGIMAPFAEADPFLIPQVQEAFKSGLEINGTTYDLEIVTADDQSNPDRSSTIASQFINGDQVNLMLAMNALTHVPVSSQCEIAGVPCITTMDPWQGWMFPLGGQPDTGFEYVNHFFWGIEDIISLYVGMWDSLPTNKVIGSCWPNDPPGKVFGDPVIGFPAALGKAGFQVLETGTFQPGADDFSQQIVYFRDNGVEIVTGLFSPPEWAVFWRQAAQLGFKPKVATVAKALLFPSGIEALGNTGDGMSTEIWWTPEYPFKSSITGQTSKELADAYSAATGKTWTQPLGVVHALWEAGIGALKASGDPTNPEAVAAAARSQVIDTVVGKLDWANSGVKNVAKLKIAGGQWRLQDDGKYDLVVTYNKSAPDVPLGGEFSLELGS